ncbi:MAG: zinc metallopeptidase [Alphaproteobacteria bacterium]|nr:zinc metallopeptidase [Alphaproteobacteria bacterium]
MKWEGRRQSSNVEDNRGSGGGGLGGLGGLGSIFGGRGGGGLSFPTGGRAPVRSGGMGLGTIVIIGIILWAVFGINPLQLLGGMFGGGGGMSLPSGRTSVQDTATPAGSTASNDKMRQFVAVVLADTEDVWHEIFRAAGEDYAEPSMVLFSGQVQSACGAASASMGPFYCPGDRKVYLDLDFFNELSTRFQAAGDFAQAYVIAHEVGHHVQTLLGISSAVMQERQGASEEEANALSVRQELQADCFAGVWAANAQRTKSILEPGDIDEALRAASAVGDDTIQRRSRGYVVPESFTHGTAEQRQRWFKTGFESGRINTCDTFKAGTL